MKHIKEFAKQFCRGLEVNKKEWDNLPLSKQSDESLKIKTQPCFT